MEVFHVEYSHQVSFMKDWCKQTKAKMSYKDRFAYWKFKRFDSRPIWFGSNHHLQYAQKRDMDNNRVLKASEKWEIADLYYDVDKHEDISKNLY